MPRRVPAWFALALIATPLAAQTRYGGGTSCLADSANPIIYQELVLPWPAPPLDHWRMEYRALLEHEATHVEQMARYPSCAAMQAIWEGPARVDSLLAWEAEAGCAQIKVYVAHGMDARDLVGVFVSKLREKVNGEKSLPEILAALSRKCPLPEAGP